MAYRLAVADRLARTVRERAAEQLEEAVSHLQGHGGHDPVEAVHEARKSLKKARSLLRLVRRDLDPAVFRRENRALRDAGRALSGLRDADVMRETLEQLAEPAVGRVPKQELDELRDWLEQRSHARRNGGAVARARRVADDLGDTVARIEDLPLRSVRWKTVHRGVRRIYREGRRALRRVEADPTVERLHEWRKRVKDLWHHQRLLREAWPALLAEQAKQAHELSDLLGRDHDLAVLAELLRGRRGGPAGVGALLELIEHERAELQKRARDLGHRVYAESPRAFARRLKRYLRAARTARPLSVGSH
jgi:CHAD domain-containing protein